MLSIASGRVDPRALLRSVRRAEGMAPARSIGRGTALSLVALAGLGAFGAVVVKAQEDAGVLAFIRNQTRPIADSRPRLPAAFTAGWGRSAPARPQSVAIGYAPARSQSVAIAYAPAVPYGAQVRLPTPDPRTVPAFVPTERAAPRRSGTVHLSPPAQGKGTGVAYCVRTCDGFFFPLGVSTGSAVGDEAACASLCPASETRVYTRRIGDEMDVARSRRDGSPYAALPAAFTHRNSYKASCSCTGKGVGLATDYSARYDQTLRVGDAVMTARGMMFFNGGARVPYRDASFTVLSRSDLVDKGTRETLRRMEQASLPRASGFAPVPLAARPAPKQVASASMASDMPVQIRDVAPGISRR
jgi:hypothetical protein